MPLTILRRRALGAVILISSLAMVACSGAPPDEAGGDRQVAINVAPNALPGVSEVCYELTVTNSAGKVVWQRDEICSSRFGSAAGDISYDGPCDARKNPNEVELVLSRITGPDGAIDFANPCPPGAPCRQTVQCGAGATTPVDFQPAVTLFDKHQGFVGIGVDLDAVYCSARLDCAAGAGSDPLLILRDPITGARVPSAVLDTACFRADGRPLFLYGSDVTVECDGIDATLDPALGPGNPFTTTPAPAGIRAASIYDAPGGDPAQQSFALALALEPGARSCRLRGAFAPLTSAAAIAVPLGFVIPQGRPVINVDVALSDAAGDLSCTHHALNAPGSGISAATVGAGGRTLAHPLGAGGCEVSPGPDGNPMVTCRGDATLDGACAYSALDDAVVCNGASAPLAPGSAGAYHAVAELHNRLLAYHRAHGAFPLATASPTPSVTCCGFGVRECPANPGAWQGIDAWELLDFSVATAHDFVLAYAGTSGSAAVVNAGTEFYCDGVVDQLILDCSDTSGVPVCSLIPRPRQDPAGSCVLSTDDGGTTITCTGDYATIDSSCSMSSSGAGTTVTCGAASATFAPGYDSAVRHLAEIQGGIMSHIHQHYSVVDGAASATPAASCCAAGGVNECAADAAAWRGVAAWDALGFAIATSHPFVYSYSGHAGGQAVVVAEGDLDCDNEVVQYTLTCTGPDGRLQPTSCTLRAPSLLE